MIIHILGLSGSGKTTLGKRLSKLPNTIVIDTDDIDDPNSMKLVSKYSFDSKKDERMLEKELAEKNKKQVDKIMKDNKDKNIIFVGFFHAGMQHLLAKIDKGYSIKIDASTLWRRYNMRTATYIHNNYNEIKKILESTIEDKKIHFIFSKKFGIRDGFDCAGFDDMANFIANMKKRAIENNYSYMTSDKIFDNITKLLKN